MLQAYRVLRDIFALIGLITTILALAYLLRAQLLKACINSLRAKNSFSLETKEILVSPSFDRVTLGTTVIKNPSHYGAGDALVFSKVDIHFHSPVRLQGVWHVKEAQFVIDRLNIIKGSRGDNLDELGILIKAIDASRQLQHRFKADEVIIVLHKIAFIDPFMPNSSTVAAVNLQISDQQVTTYTKIYESLIKLIGEIGKSG